jgi:intracellular septation protein A
LIKTWLHILAELESIKVTEIFRIYCEFFLLNPTFFEKLNIQPLIDVFLKLENRKKEKLSDCLKEVFFLFPNRNEILNSIPPSTLQKLKIL